MKKIIITSLKIIIFLVIWVFQMTILIYFTMEFYGELRPNPSIAIGGLTSLYLSYIFVKKLNISKFLISFKRSHKKESRKIDTSELTIEKSKSKILYMPKKIFYIISSLFLTVIIFVLSINYYEENYNAINRIISPRYNPDSEFFEFYINENMTDNTVDVDGLRYNIHDMTLYSGVFRSEDKWNKEDENTTIVVECNYLNGKIHGKYYSFRMFDGWYARGNYREGQKHGLFEEWHKNGQLKSRGKYSNGEIIGKLEKWAIDGKPIY
jgi:antitoxin component YwqK of YwqJK toxin-antitoxin module